MSAAATDWEGKRIRMVESQIKRRGIHDPRVLEAMGAIPRELFVPEQQRAKSYADEPIPIGHGQTISQPYMTALMAEVLDLRGSDRVLEVGTGCGYHAAVFARLAAEVISIEIVGPLAAEARRTLALAGCAGNVTVVEGDGSLGYPELAPYDAISVAAAAPGIPQPLIDQLRDGGRVVIPVGSLEEQDLLVLTKSGDRTWTRVAAHCRFVPLLGGEGWKLD